MTVSTNVVSLLDAFELAEAVVVTTNLTINEGDLVFWDGTNFTATPLTSAAQVQNQFLGVALGANNPAVYGGDPLLPSVPVLGKGCVYMSSTAGETYNHFDPVTVGVDSQTITKTGVTVNNRVGFVVISPPASARALQATPVPETVGGAASVRLRIQLEPKHPIAIAL